VGGAGPDGAGTFLLFVSPTCPLCKTLLSVVERVARAEGRRLRVILASDGPRAEHEAFVREHGLDARTYVLSTPLGLAFQVAKLPHAVLLDAQGIVRAQGLVNTREHLESLFEAEARGVASIQEYLARTGTESA
jgi:methylamine dehydrogenase accessory protein MauD